MAIVITNPETGQKHEMDEAALSELRDAIAFELDLEQCRARRRCIEEAYRACNRALEGA